MVGPGIVFIGFASVAMITIFYLIKSRHMETMARIEHGMSEGGESRPNYLLLNLGLFLCFLGGGIFISYMIIEFTSLPDYVAMPGCLLVSGGLGLIVGHLISRQKSK